MKRLLSVCVSVTQVSSWWERICHLLIYSFVICEPNKMKPMHKYVHSISLVCLYSILVFYKMSLLWPFPSGVDLSVRLTEAFIQSAGISYTGCSATWQREIIFTHRQLWLSGPRSAKKRQHRWRERENTEVGWWRVDFAISYRPRHNRALNISSVGWCVLGDMFVGLHECECILRVRVSSECVSQRIMQPAEAT